ncbi:MAG: gliding motility-associated C-terminal domain-containing protein, partial [Bacteroidetes bacterium]|nr:gliding motility-associated C-terminal domain-containing protein [Bacteroidota bacterium]
SKALVNQTIYFTDKSTNSPITWLWKFGDSSKDSTSTLQNPSHGYAVGGFYNVCLIVTDINGCSDTVCKTVVILLPPKVPSGFTPNGDGENDIFYVYGGPFKTLDLKIYNNWGELIFQSDKQSLGWDGKRKGIDQAVGVYVWTVVGVTEDDEKYELSGDVTLIR